MVILWHRVMHEMVETPARFRKSSRKTCKPFIFRRSAHATDPASRSFREVFAIIFRKRWPENFFEKQISSTRSIWSKNRQNPSYPRDFSAVRSFWVPKNGIFERPFTPRGWLRSASNFGKTRFRRSPTFHLSTSKKNFGENF